MNHQRPFVASDSGAAPSTQDMSNGKKSLSHHSGKDDNRLGEPHWSNNDPLQQQQQRRRWQQQQSYSPTDRKVFRNILEQEEEFDQQFAAATTTRNRKSTSEQHFDENGHRCGDDIEDLDDYNDRSFEEAVAVSSALVGENVLDSPPGRSGRNAYEVTFDSSERTASIMAPPLSASDNNNGSCSALKTATTRGPYAASTSNAMKSVSKIRPAAATAAPASSPTTQIARPCPSVTNEEALHVGLMAQGLAWVRRQRDRRQRQYLQHQAEQQLRKLQEAQAAEKAVKLQQQQQQKTQLANQKTSAVADPPAVNNNRSLVDNATFQTVAAHNPSFQNLAHTICLKNSRSSEFSEDSYDGSSGATTPKSTTGGHYASCQPKTAMVSKSGDGYTVEIPVSDDEGGGDNIKQEDDPSFVPPVRIVDEPDLDDNPYILSRPEMQQIAVNVLPRGIAYCRWKRLYSLARDGDSFDSCLRLITGATKTLLIVRTARDAVFGGFADEPWDTPQTRRGGGPRYHGGPAACLFKAVSAFSHEENGGCGDSRQRKIVCYNWSGANRYIQLTDYDHKRLAFGGGGDKGAFGLALQEDFQVGTTGPCDTFANEPLCPEGNFEIVDMEVFGFLLGQF